MSITDKSIKNVDVLCGRGNKINYREGNVRFRKLIDENRYDYVTAPRHSKVQIASRVIASVHKSGGRFLGLNPKTKKWEEVPIRRATEKACQALREDASSKVAVPEKRKRSDTGNSGSNKKKNSAKKPSGSLKNTNQTKSAQSGGKRTSKNESSARSTKSSVKASTKGSDSTSQLRKKSKKKKRKKDGKERKFLTEEQIAQGAALHDEIELAQLSGEGDADISSYIVPTVEDDPNARPFRWSDTQTDEEWENMYQRLERFRKILGHAAVPPSWAGDVELAHWACRQRHLYREVVRTSHRAASDVETMRIHMLEDVDFVWEYDKWCLHRCDKDTDKPPDNNEVNGGAIPGATSEANTISLDDKTEIDAVDKLSNLKTTHVQSLTVNIIHQEETDDEDFLLI